MLNIMKADAGKAARVFVGTAFGFALVFGVLFGVLFSGKVFAVENWGFFDEFDVPADTTTPTVRDVLKNNVKYKVTATGTYTAGDGITADAKCSSRYGSPLADSVDNYESYGPELLDLFINGSSDWGDCSSDHEYTMYVMGDGTQLEAYIDDIYPSNNEGNLHVYVEEFIRTAEITAPEEDAYEMGEVTFEAYLSDDDVDAIQWAVREGTCAMGTNTVFGNVDNHTNVADIDTSDVSEQTFFFTADMSGMTPGMYCFIYNPVEDSGEDGIRLTREFYLLDGNVHGGGQIIEEQEFERKGKPEEYKISFGGQLYDAGPAGIFGDWEVNFHNVGDDDFDKSKFHGDEITEVNFFDGSSNTCDEAVNFTVLGSLDGEEGYRMILRAGDWGNGNYGNSSNVEEDFNADTVRIELYKVGEGKVYDTHPNEFTDESSCVGSARTGLDKGNITIEMN